MFSKKVQSYINQIMVEEEEMQQDEKVFCQQAESINSCCCLHEITAQKQATELVIVAACDLAWTTK